MVEVFKSNVRTKKEAHFILKRLQISFPDCKINFDLEDCDKILRMETKYKSIDTKTVIAMVENHGFEIEPMSDEIPQKRKIKFLGAFKYSSCFLFLITALNACGASKQINCIDTSKISNGPCTLEYSPVCGCNGKTYSNPCQAERSGVGTWKIGECVN